MLAWVRQCLTSRSSLAKVPEHQHLGQSVQQPRTSRLHVPVKDSRFLFTMLRISFGRGILYYILIHFV